MKLASIVRSFRTQAFVLLFLLWTAIESKHSDLTEDLPLRPEREIRAKKPRAPQCNDPAETPAANIPLRAAPAIRAWAWARVTFSAAASRVLLVAARAGLYHCCRSCRPVPCGSRALMPCKGLLFLARIQSFAFPTPRGCRQRGRQRNGSGECGLEGGGGGRGGERQSEK
jgi:hypothetical protein